jgi:hypothetical protein
MAWWKVALIGAGGVAVGGGVVYLAVAFAFWRAYRDTH